MNNLDELKKNLEEISFQLKVILNEDKTINEFNKDMLLRKIQDFYLGVKKYEVILDDSEIEMPNIEFGISSDYNVSIDDSKIEQSEVVEKKEIIIEAIDDKDDISYKQDINVEKTIKKEDVFKSEPNLFTSLFSVDDTALSTERKQDSEELVKEQTLESSSVHQKYSDNIDSKSIADKLSGKKIEDLNKAIGINQRFLFINELFDGDIESFKKQISILNDFNSFDEVEHHIENNLLKVYSWDIDSDPYKQFMDLLIKRYV